jgi:hypothetical protein
VVTILDTDQGMVTLKMKARIRMIVCLFELLKKNEKNA